MAGKDLGPSPTAPEPFEEHFFFFAVFRPDWADPALGSAGRAFGMGGALLTSPRLLVLGISPAGQGLGSVQAVCNTPGGGLCLKLLTLSRSALTFCEAF